MKTKNTRFQMDFSEAALKRLDEIKDKAMLASRAELVRQALKLYEWHREKKAEGYTFQIAKDDEVIQVEFLND